MPSFGNCTWLSSAPSRSSGDEATTSQARLAVATQAMALPDAVTEAAPARPVTLTMFVVLASQAILKKRITLAPGASAVLAEEKNIGVSVPRQSFTTARLVRATVPQLVTVMR